MKNLQTFACFRKYLRDYYIFRKKNGGFSYRQFADMAGLLSPNYLKLVIDGKRNLTNQNTYKLAKALRLDFNETKFFETLVHYGQASEEKKYYKAKLQELKEELSDLHIKQRTTQELFAKWYYPYILIALDGKEEKSAVKIIKSLTSLPVQSITEGINQMLELKLVEIHQGTYRLSSNFLAISDQNNNQLKTRQFLKDQTFLSAKVFDDLYAKESKFLSLGFTISESSFDYFADKMDIFLDKIATEANQQKPEKVVQLNLQLFPVKEGLSKKSKALFGNQG